MDATVNVGSPRAMVRPAPAALAGLRVALVHDWLTGLRGGEKCLEALCAAFPSATIHTLIHKPGTAGPIIEAMQIRTSPLQRLPGIHAHYRHLLPVMPLAARSWHVGDVDLVVSLSHCVAKAVKVPRGVPHVCYCFTPMRYAWDGRASYLESWRGRPLRRAIASSLLDRLREWDRESARGVTHFVAISETIRERISRCYGRDSRIVHPPVDTLYYTPGAGPREDFYLCVSALVPYKRIDQAIAACRDTGRRLIVIGEGPDRARLERLGGAGIEFLGWQPDEVIRDHYRRCKALLFPGEEDFGIVPIEALACGAPVIALNRGGVAETVHDRIGRVYSEPTEQGLARAISGWEAEGSPHDPTAARAAAERFAPQVFRDRILGLLSEVIANRPGAVPPRPHIAGDAGASSRKPFESRGSRP